MKRAAVLIAGLAPDLKGVQADVDNLKAFLMSAAGGGWRANEITSLANPGTTAVDSLLSGLATTTDYTFVAFAGHGDHHDGQTRVQLSSGVVIPADRLKIGAKKHTLLIDCCRVVTRVSNRSFSAVMEKAAAEGVDLATARHAFDNELDRCPNGLVTMYSCAVNETAGENESGGFFTSSLLEAARSWSKHSHPGPGRYRCMNVVEAHDATISNVQRMSGGRQTPKLDKPRSGPYFPFAIA